jgi:hypothetical protein
MGMHGAISGAWFCQLFRKLKWVWGRCSEFDRLTGSGYGSTEEVVITTPDRCPGLSLPFRRPST